MTTEIELERRSLCRHEVCFDGTLRSTGKSARQITILDLSTGGCAIDPAGFLTLNQLVWVRLPGLESWEASVAWVKQGCAGIRFSRPMHAAVIERYVSRYATVRRSFQAAVC
jgi:hypothetical protein